MSESVRRQSPWVTFLALAFVAVGLWALVKFVVMRHPGEEAPRPLLSRLQLEPLTGDAKPRSLADLEGKVALVNFWGTWCGPCVQEFPHMVALEREFRDRADFELLSVSCHPTAETETKAALRAATQAFLDRAEVALDTHYDPEGVTRQAVAAAVGFEGYPTTVLLDREGKLADHWVGYSKGMEHDVRAAVADALEE